MTKTMMNSNNIVVPTLNIAEAVQAFRAAGIATSEDKLGTGIEQGVYPFGICIKRGKNRSYEIYKKLLDDYLTQRGL